LNSIILPRDKFGVALLQTGYLMQRLNNKTCVITGAARGIGAAIAKAFSDEGANVILTDINYDAVKHAAKTLGQTAFELNVANETHWERLSQAHPHIDVMVNNAGITGFEDSTASQNPETATLENWRRVHRVNLEGTFLGCRYAIKAMREKGAGAIINISSRSGMVGIPQAAAYASSKAAIRNHTKSVALYCAEQGLDIRCNSIHPAAILTPMWEPMLGDGEDREARMASFVADTPAQRFGEPEEVAALALLLASDEARYITGTEMTIDGGLLSGSAAAPKRA
jgi:NAD(P)-dependent dehydrogenase (short-subunit alcohol dehydrogenase family)